MNLCIIDTQLCIIVSIAFEGISGEGFEGGIPNMGVEREKKASKSGIIFNTIIVSACSSVKCGLEKLPNTFQHINCR